MLAIGNFDGVHRGHRAVIAAALARAKALGRPAAALTFEPHPRGFFRPNEPLFRLTDERAKLRLLATTGLDGAIVLRFDAALAGLSAAISSRAFWSGGLPSPASSSASIFISASIATVRPNILRRRVRSSALRSISCRGSRTRDGRFAPARSARRLPPVTSREANELLGYPWFVSAEVVHGDKRGRELGYPTANLRLDPGCGLKHGIYAVRVGIGARRYDGVASFGRRPMFDQGTVLLEVFLFDFTGDLYGEVVDVAFVDWIRPELKFDSVEASSTGWTRIRGSRAPCWRLRRRISAARTDGSA